VRLLLLTTAFMSVLVLPRLYGQAPARSDATLVFEAASVKPNHSRNCDRDGTLAGGRFVMTCSTLRELVVFAYPRQDGRVRSDSEFAGGPSWISADRFDVVANAPAGQGVGVDAANSGAGAATPAVLSAIDRIRQMAQAMLVDRFTLRVHHESRELAVYDLRMDRNDRAPGPQLKKVDVDCVSQPRGRGQLCGGFRTLGPGHIVGGAMTMPLLAQYLEIPVSRNVLDRTGLHGTFDLELQYTPERPQIRGPDTPAVDPTGVSVFTALREQLGLKLESAKTPIDVLVIDKAEKPTPD
jgi:bla regulator protein blaR1